MSVVGVAKLVSEKTRVVEVDGPVAARTSQLYYLADDRYRPAQVGVSLTTKAGKTRYLVSKGQTGDRLLADLAEPKLAKPYTGRGWVVE